MDSPRDHDDLLTLVAIGLLAYASADIAHHVFGHGGMCLAAGGSIRSLSSVFVDCTVRGAAIDLAGPFANLIVGVLTCGAAFQAHRSLRLFLALAAGFNLLWFALQLAFSVASRTDDFAWAMQEFHVSEPLRYGLIAMGIALYMLSMRVVARVFRPFGPSARARRIVWTAWLTAGVFACITALFDQNPVAAILHNAAPQSLALSIGLLFLPRYVVSAAEEPVIERRVSWLLAALTVAAMSIGFLGPGFAV
jgi:hypothetical protein